MTDESKKHAQEAAEKAAAVAERELEELVTALVEDYPTLTREKAREMLLAAGA
jgi:hypothetical protein